MNMLKSIMINWNFMRLLRLGLGIAIIVQAAYAGDRAMGIIGVLFTALPVFNIGCCGACACVAQPAKENAKTNKEITYEELV
jgi:hypothetical protein